VRVRYAEGAGCYGHNGSDDAAADAALISQAIGRPVRVQWSRADEHAWDPKTPATFTTLNAILDRASGRIRSWNAEIWSPSHSTRPSGEAGNLLAGQLTDVTPAKITFVGGDRNARTNYDVPNQQVTMHNLRAGILRASAMRGLGGTANTFANESFIDELAALAGADPIAFRRAHLSDPRALAVIDAVATLSNWTPRAAGSQRHSGGIARGRGMAFVRYENVHAYVATVADIAVNLTTGVIRVERISVAHDCGLIINPDGLRNQLEGNAIQATSRALKEAVEFDGERVKSVDWKTYPILRFSEIPQVALTLINRPTEPVLGAGEASTTTVAPAIANALFDATGVRVRTIPLTPTRVLAALQSAQVSA
jgi:CO/xanthine dehydrogenase Mo-binding subunit